MCVCMTIREAEGGSEWPYVVVNADQGSDKALCYDLLTVKSFHIGVSSLPGVITHHMDEEMQYRRRGSQKVWGREACLGSDKALCLTALQSGLVRCVDHHSHSSSYMGLHGVTWGLQWVAGRGGGRGSDC